MSLGSRYRRGVSRTLVFMTSTPGVPGGPRGERDTVIGCQGLLMDPSDCVARQPSEEPRDWVSWHLKFCPVLTRPRRLGLQSRASLPRRSRSSPLVTRLYHIWPRFSSALVGPMFSHQFEHPAVPLQAHVVRHRVVRMVDVAAPFFGKRDFCLDLFLDR